MAAPASCIAKAPALASRRNKQYRDAPTWRSNHSRMSTSFELERDNSNSKAIERGLVSYKQQWKASQVSRPAGSHESLKKARAKKHQVPSMLLTCSLALLLAGQTLALQVETPSHGLDPPPETTTGAPSDLITGAPLEIQAPQVSNSSKLKPVNFSLVDELFESTLEDDELVQRWRRMDSQLQEGMRSILKMVFPQIVAISQDAKVSGDCSGGILKWILSLRNLRSWAIKMLDATGKPSAGIFEGSLTMFGNYRQCLNIRAPDEDEIEISDQFEEYFRGQFCVLHLKPWLPHKKPFYHLNSTIDSLLRKNYKYYEKTLYDELAEIAIAFNFIDIRMDLCVPSTCSMADIQRVAELLSRKLEMRAKVMRCDIQSREQIGLDQFESAALAWLALPIGLILVVLLSSLLWPLLKCCQSQKSNQRSLRLILRSLSLQAALRDRFSSPLGSSLDLQASKVEKLTEKPLPLYALRSLFVFWYIVVQMTVELNYQYLRESLVLRNLILNYWPFQIIVNSSLLFESIILITAFTFGYSSLDFTLKDLVRRLANKYARLVVPMISLIALTIATPLLAIESPLWRNFVENQSATCRSNGLVNLLFLQNFIPYDKICLPHTWIFCVEMQLCLLSIPLILLLKRIHISCEDTLIVKLSDETTKKNNSKSNTEKNLFSATCYDLFTSRAGLLGVAAMCCGSLVNFLLVYHNNLPASWFYTFPDLAQKNYYFSSYLTKTWTHLASFIIGLLAGYLCRSSLRLRSLNLSRNLEQPSPIPSTSTSHTRMHSLASQGSSSTVMAMDLDTHKPDDSSSDNRSSFSTTTKHATSIGTGSRVVGAAASISALICLSCVIFSTFSWSTGKSQPSQQIAALYDAGSRLLWSLALVVLMIQLCSPGSKTNRFSSLANLLSSPFLIILGRLSFLAYLLAPYVLNFVLAVEEQPLFPSLFMIFHVTVGNIVITYLLALLMAILIEQPARQLVDRLTLNSRRSVNISNFYPSNYPKPQPDILAGQIVDEK